MCSLGACTIKTDYSDSASTDTEIESGGTESGGQSPVNTSTAGRPGAKPSATGGKSSDESGGSSGMAIGSDAAGVGGAAGDDSAPPPPCDLNGNCQSNGDGATGTCGVVSGNECEFAGFVGATAQVAWGQAAVIGLACCGQCECVPVEVYFDGVQCWQGIPQCANSRFVLPHATTTPNPSFTPNTSAYGSFHLGSGGFGGSSAAEAGVPGGNGGTGPESAPASAGHGGKHDHDDNEDDATAGHAGCAAESAPTSVTD